MDLVKSALNLICKVNNNLCLTERNKFKVLFNQKCEEKGHD